MSTFLFPNATLSNTREIFESLLCDRNASDPFDFFSINFVEDTLDIDTKGLFSHPTGTSANNYFTEETMLEEDGCGSKGIMGELKSDPTKPTEQKISGGSIMTNMPDSLGNNDSTNAGSKSGHPNTEGALISKVSTICQADENSEPLSGNLAEQKTGSQDRGIGSKKIKGSSMPARASNQDGEVLKKNEIADTG